MLSWNPRDTSVLVRDALQAYANQLENAGARQTLIQELEQEAQAGLTAIQAIVDDMAKQRRVWIANGMTEKLALPDADLGTLYSRARWQSIKVLFDQFAVWLEAPLVVQAADSENGIPEIAIPPIVIISLRD